MTGRVRNAVNRDALATVLRDVAITAIAVVGTVASFALAYLATVWLYQGLSS